MHCFRVFELFLYMGVSVQEEAMNVMRESFAYFFVFE